MHLKPRARAIIHFWRSMPHHLLAVVIHLRKIRPVHLLHLARIHFSSSKLLPPTRSKVRPARTSSHLNRRKITTKIRLLILIIINLLRVQIHLLAIMPRQTLVTTPSPTRRPHHLVLLQTHSSMLVTIIISRRLQQIRVVVFSTLEFQTLKGRRTTTIILNKIILRACLQLKLGRSEGLQDRLATDFDNL